MQFQFTPDQQDLIQATHEMLLAETPIARLRALSQGADGTDISDQLAAMGLPSLLLPEAQGGLAQDFVVMAAIAESAGYVNLPEDLVEQAGLVLPRLVALQQEDLLRDALAGKVKVGLVSALRPYLEARSYDYFIVDDRLVPAAEIATTPVKTIDPLRNLVKPDVAAATLLAIEDQGAVLAAAQLLGLARRMIDMAVDYAKEREQFGQKIGQFQAVKHLLASVYTQIEFTRPLIWLAAQTGGAHVNNAKISAIDTAMQASETAIQIFGGMGYTFEVDLHLFMKRAWALCGVWGDRSYHMHRLETLILDGSMEIGPGISFR
jgi:alkylation response protein AidB-like acyl-CoA dehydrogenase